MSLVIPAYNEETRLPSTLEQVTAFLDAQPYEYEVLVVENGSRDRTIDIAEAFERRHPNIRVLREIEPGKGRAVRRGILEARGEYRFMCDADLSVPIQAINLFLPPVLEEFDVAIGSREALGAVRYDEPSYRHIGGRLINMMIRCVVLPGCNDTQCGFKCFHWRVSEDLFQAQSLTGWAFDAEVLYIARKRGYVIREVAIPWYYRAESKVHVIHDGLRMLLDVLRVRWNDLRGVYGQTSNAIRREGAPVSLAPAAPPTRLPRR